MTNPGDWVTGSDVAARLRMSGTPRHAEVAAAACQLVRQRHSLTTDPALGNDPAVFEGTVRWGVLLYKADNTPQGFTQYSDFDTVAEYSDSMSEIYRLIGLDPVVA